MKEDLLLKIDTIDLTVIQKILRLCYTIKRKSRMYTREMLPVVFTFMSMSVQISILDRGFLKVNLI